ncbi:MAG: RNA methyltransferase [Saprospiraceae bacterium]|nr:RNA methyltransferase [Saprospiraceae bacterium]
MELPQVSKSQIKFLQSLKLKKYRQKYGSFLVEGRKAVDEILKDNGLKIKSLYAVAPWFEKTEPQYLSNIYQQHTISDHILKQISTLTTPDQVIIECEIPTEKAPDSNAGWVLFLDGISDPGNLGTIIRTADWFGINYVCMAPGTVDVFNPKCVQATMASIGRLNFYYGDLKQISEVLIDHPVLIADMSGEPIQKVVSSSPAVVVIGNESHGVSTDILENPDYRKVAISRAPESRAESLNAAVACAAILSILLLPG